MLKIWTHSIAGLIVQLLEILNYFSSYLVSILLNNCCEGMIHFASKHNNYVCSGQTIILKYAIVICQFSELNSYWHIIYVSHSFSTYPMVSNRFFCRSQIFGSKTESGATFSKMGKIIFFIFYQIGKRKEEEFYH